MGSQDEQKKPKEDDYLLRDFLIFILLSLHDVTLRLQFYFLLLQLLWAWFQPPQLKELSELEQFLLSFSPLLPLISPPLLSASLLLLSTSLLQLSTCPLLLSAIVL